MTPSLPKIGDRLSDYVARVSQLREFKKREGDGTFHVFRAVNAHGAIGCVIWTPRVDFKNGDYLKLAGEVKAHKEAPQFVVARYEILPRDQFPPETFVPVSHRPLDEMVDELRMVIAGVESRAIARMLTHLLLDDPDTAPAYQRAPAAKSHHHPFRHGLLEHNLTVVKRALGMCLSGDGVDRDVVIAGALLHDIGKVEEYRYDGDEIAFTEVGNLIGHVSLGYALVRRAIAAQGDIPVAQATNLLHVILSHQGRLDYGSPVEPRTAEAFIVHHADSVDAHLFQVRRAGEEFPESRLGFAKSLNRMVLGNPDLPYDEGYRH
jgi:3'-5' exoribonuclease